MRRSSVVGLVLGVALAVTSGANAEPLSARSEDVQVTTIDGSLGDIAPGISIDYQITVTRTSGKYLVNGTAAPGATYSRTTGCLEVSSSFFTSKRCVKMSSGAFTQDAKLDRSTGTFRVTFREVGQTVAVAFVVAGKGATSNDTPLAQSVSPTDRSAAATFGPWSRRQGTASGTLGTTGGKVKIVGTATLAQSSGTTLAVDV